MYAATQPHLSLLILIFVKEFLGLLLFTQRPNGGQSLQCGGEVGVNWTACYIDIIHTSSLLLHMQKRK